MYILDFIRLDHIIIMMMIYYCTLQHVNNTLVCQVLATDADEGRNSEIVYSFLNAQDLFTINSTTGEIYTKGSLDHEMQSIYNVSSYIACYYKHVMY